MILEYFSDVFKKKLINFLYNEFTELLQKFL